MNEEKDKSLKSGFRCPLCSTTLAEYPKGSAVLFICSSCDFKILTTKELFPKCFKNTGRWRFTFRPNPYPTVSYEGPKGIKGFLSHAELQEFVGIMEQDATSEKLNKFPFPRYSHETIMDLLEIHCLGEKHE